MAPPPRSYAESNTPDGFVHAADHAYHAEHVLLDEHLKKGKSSDLEARSSKFEKPAQLVLLTAAMQRMEFRKSHGRDHAALSGLIKKLAGRKLPFTEPLLIANLRLAANILAPKDPEHVQFDELDSPIPGVVPALLEEVEAQKKPLSDELLAPLTRLHAALKPMEFWAGYKKTVQRLEALIEQKQPGLPDEGEPWAEAIRADIASMPPSQRKHWLALLENAPKGTTTKPTAQWKKQAGALLAEVGEEEFAKQVEQCFALVGKNAAARIQPRNAALLRGLVWYASLLQGESICRALANAVEGGLRKLQAGSLYASNISKACIAALETIGGVEAIAQLYRLKHRVTSPWGLQEIEKALNASIEQSGISRDEVEEISLPTFGLDKTGTLRQQIENHSVELSIRGTRDVVVKWLNPQGEETTKPDLSKAAAPRAKAVRQLACDIEKMLGAQRDRLDNFLERDRSWTFDVWRSRYLEHPLMINLSRLLVWHFRQGKRSASGVWQDGRFVEATGREIAWLTPKTEVRLWHPLGIEAAEVREWRHALERYQTTQPFKQAHREIYVLTDAERETRTYSNRFATHILRQHQFKALCDQRSWRYEFLGSWDQPDSIATRALHAWELRAEYWIQHAGTEYSTSGVALHVATDQVRFRTPDDQVVDLENVPALVFSEIMRDVDLFVSVCSVGNDPTWADGGTDRPRDYWREWSFGELSATARTRHEILEQLLPRLKIAHQCSLEPRFLVVRGQLRTYKIHLGSGNILMSPNDQYLCIVPDRDGQAKLAEKVFLPFEGDRTLSVILSKAFLLAEDSKITDSTILSQIRRT